MVEFIPYPALTYDQAIPSKKIISPPYDVGTQDHWNGLVRDGHLNVHLVRPYDYDFARHQYESCLRDGRLKINPTPSYQFYKQEFTAPDGSRKTRTHIVGLIKLDTTGKIIQPHEEIKAKPLEDRLKLLSTMNAHSEMGLYAYSGDGSLTGDLDEYIQKQDPFREFRDHHGVQHTSYIISDPKLNSKIRSSMKDKTITILDGHHRYITSLIYHLGEKFLKSEELYHHYKKLREKLTTNGMLKGIDLDKLKGPNIYGSMYIPACLCDSEENDLVILDTKRALKLDNGELGRLVNTLNRKFQETKFESKEKMLGSMKDGRDAFGVEIDGNYFVYRLPDDRKANLEKTKQGLSVGIVNWVLQHKDNMGLNLDDDLRIRYAISQKELDDVIGGGFNTAIIYPQAPLHKEVVEVAKENDVFGPKSTGYIPKIYAGWTIYDLFIFDVIQKLTKQKVDITPEIFTRQLLEIRKDHLITH